MTTTLATINYNSKIDGVEELVEQSRYHVIAINNQGHVHHYTTWQKSPNRYACST